jgi:hypothetical protein
MDRSSPLKIKGYDDNCPICYEYWAEAAPWVFPCGHMICEKCYLKQKKVKRQCHICRERFNVKQNRKRRGRRNKNSDSESGTSWSSWGTLDGWD